MINNIFNKIINYIRCDNRLEFDNKIKEICNAKGVMLSSSQASHNTTNSMDGPIDSKIFKQTLISNANALLRNGKLDRHFWENTVRTINYIYNRLTYKGIYNKSHTNVLMEKIKINIILYFIIYTNIYSFIFLYIILMK